MARVKSGAFKARKGIPADVRNEYAALHGRRWEELFRAPQDCTPQRAKALRNEWEAEIDTRIATLRAKQRGEGRDLTQKQAHALAGDWYRWFTALYEDNPGSPDRWDSLCEALDIVTPIDPETGRIDWDEVREEIHPRLADEAKTAQFLASKGEVLTRAAMTLLLNAVFLEIREAADLLRRRAAGNYSPDQHLQTLPVYTGPKAANEPKSGQTCLGLFEAYVKAKKRAASTVERWRVVFPTLDAHLSANGWSIDDFGPDEAQRWATSLIGSGSPPRGAYTVKNTWVGAASIVLRWAVKQKLLKSNPFAEVAIDVPRKAQTREDGKGFSEAEQQTILKAALAIKDPSSPVKAAYRWVPWLCAYSGARAGEITQLRGQDIERRNGFVVMKLTPDAGTIKGLKMRVVPIHEHVIEQGFLEYVKAKGQGPLFYKPDTAQRGDEDQLEDPLKPKRPRAVQTRNKLAEWVRKLGITDTEIQPNHAWRHTFKATARRAGIEKGIRVAVAVRAIDCARNAMVCFLCATRGGPRRNSYTSASDVGPDLGVDRDRTDRVGSHLIPARTWMACRA
jgi:integrase